MRCFQLGLRMADLEVLDYGDVIDMMTEAGNDDAEWNVLATQDDFDRF